MQISELEAPVRLEVQKMTSLDKNVWQRNVRLLEEYCGKTIAEIEREYNDAITGIEFEMQKKIHHYWMLAVYIQYRKKHSGNYLVFQKQA